MGRTPDYKAAFASCLGANPEYYGQFADNARNWYKRIQESGLYFNHAIVNPPIDRHKPADEVKMSISSWKKKLMQVSSSAAQKWLPLTPP